MPGEIKNARNHHRGNNRKKTKKGKEKKDDKNKIQKMRSWHHKKTNHK